MACREYTHPRDEGSSQPKRWIQGNMRIGPVLEVTTSSKNFKLKRSQQGNGVDEVMLALRASSAQSLAACMVTSPTLVDGRQCKQCATTWRHTALANTRERFHKIGCCLIALRLVAIAIGWCREVQGRCSDLVGLKRRRCITTKRMDAGKYKNWTRDRSCNLSFFQSEEQALQLDAKYFAC